MQVGLRVRHQQRYKSALPGDGDLCATRSSPLGQSQKPQEQLHSTYKPCHTELMFLGSDDEYGVGNALPDFAPCCDPKDVMGPPVGNPQPRLVHDGRPVDRDLGVQELETFDLDHDAHSPPYPENTFLAGSGFSMDQDDCSCCHDLKFRSPLASIFSPRPHFPPEYSDDSHRGHDERVDLEPSVESKHDPRGDKASASHRGRRHACEDCSRLFSRPENLRRHRLSVHRARKALECGRCGSSFTRSGNLAQHVGGRRCEQRAQTSKRRSRAKGQNGS